MTEVVNCAAARGAIASGDLDVSIAPRTYATYERRLCAVLETLCFGDSSVEAYRLSRATVRRWAMSERRQRFHWGRARQKFGLVGDDVHDDDDAGHWVEEEILAETLGHWDAAARRHRYRWWNQPRLRDLATERELTLFEVAEKLALARSNKTQRRAGTRKETRLTIMPIMAKIATCQNPRPS